MKRKIAAFFWIVFVVSGTITLFMADKLDQPWWTTWAYLFIGIVAVLAVFISFIFAVFVLMEDPL